MSEPEAKRRRISGPIRRIGIVGYGKLGQYLAHAIVKRDDMELAFVWNRNPKVVLGDPKVAPSLLEDLSKFAERLVRKHSSLSGRQLRRHSSPDYVCTDHRISLLKWLIQT